MGVLRYKQVWWASYYHGRTGRGEVLIHIGHMIFRAIFHDRILGPSPSEEEITGAKNARLPLAAVAGAPPSFYSPVSITDVVITLEASLCSTGGTN